MACACRWPSTRHTCDERCTRTIWAVAVGPPPGVGADVSSADAARAGTLACALAHGAGPLGNPGSRGPGQGRPHGWELAGGLPASWPSGPRLPADGRFPPALNGEEQAELKAAIQAPPREAGIELSNWNWKVVREFVKRRFGRLLCRSSCLNYLHRLGFVLNRPKKLLLKADADKRAAFVAFYAGLRAEAEASGAKVFFVDEAIWDWAREEVTANTCHRLR